MLRAWTSARVIVFIHEKTKAFFRLHRSFTSIPMNALTAVLASQSALYRQSSPSTTFQNNGRPSRRSMPTGTWQKKAKSQSPEAPPMKCPPQPGGISAMRLLRFYDRSCWHRRGYKKVPLLHQLADLIRYAGVREGTGLRETGR